LDSVWKYVYLLFYGSLQIKNKVNKRQKQARLPVHAKLLNLETESRKNVHPGNESCDPSMFKQFAFDDRACPARRCLD
jgi:hypothetical protein